LLRTEEIPRSIIILTVGLVTVTLSLRRLVCRLLLYNDFRHGVGTRNALIVGTGPKAHALRNYLEREKSLGYTFRGFIGFPGADSNASAHSDAVVGSFDTLFQRARKKFIDVIILTGPFNYGPIDGIVEQAQIRGVDLRIVPDMYEGLHGQTPIEYFGPFPTILLHRSESPEIRLAIKRMFDILFSSAILITISPLLLAIAIAVKLDSRGPVFYTSERIGKKGRVFNCIKFRTMVRDAENRRAEVMHLNERDGVLFKISDDPRVTRLGRLLRKSSLDELPQFLNVLLGDMSTVGPRPPLGSEVEEYKLRHLRRLDVTPGITGLWQVQARQDPSFDSYVSLDVSYIENWSLGLDMKIILRTIGVVFSGTGS
jgi:exopolysaccharide biosynthesis polyprenyl glycosylphosphotransferase